MIVFAVGFIAAALSSMLTVALGASITADTVYSDIQEDGPKEVDNDYGSIEKNGKKGNMTQEQSGQGQKLPRWAYQGMMWVMVLISTAIVSANGK